MTEKEEKHYVLIKDFNRFMYDHSLHCGRKHFCRKQAFVTEDISEQYIKNFFKINSKERILMPKKVNMLNSRILKDK